MKILKVAFKNLNSLRGEHSVDFSAGPLSRTGIFAITGPTGAGKSTILDAITLALYGRAARYGTTPSPENMMSRHTGECQAEVVFSVASGEFRASWHLKRARGKIDGNLQPPQRRVFDAAGVTLAQKVFDADGLIESLTGLDYDRFLRSVLLAQGEFARFLKADADTRAGLLERLTGTDIYSRLSVLAHEQASEREAALSREQAAREAIPWLGEEERAVKTGEITRLGDELAASAQTLEALSAQRELGRRLQGALAEAERLQTRGRELTARREECAADFARLERHERTQPFCADLARLDANAARADEEWARWNAAQREARDADARLSRARAAARILAGREVAACEREVVRHRDEEASANARLSGVNRWLEEHADEQGLETALPVISEKLALLSGARRRRDELRASGEKLSGREAGLRAHREETRSRLTSILADLEHSKTSHEQVAVELSALLAGRAPSDLQESLAGLHRRKESLTRLGSLLQKSIAADDKAKSLAQTGEALAQILPRYQEEVEQARGACAVLGELVEAQAESLTNAKLVASFAAHRAGLKAGEACPLCGSGEHPFADPTGGVPSPDLDAIAAKLAKGRKDLKAADLTRREKEEVVTRVSEQHRTAVEQLELAERDGASARRDFDLEAAARSFTSHDPVMLRSEIEAVEGSINLAGEQLAALETLKNRQDAAALAHNSLQSQTSKLEETLRASEAALELAGQDCAAQAVMLAEHEAALDLLAAGVVLVLAPFAQALPDAGGEAAGRANLEARRAEYASHLTSKSDIASALQALGHAVRVAQGEWERARRQADDLPTLDPSSLEDDAEAARLAGEWQTYAAARARVEEYGAAAIAARATEENRLASQQKSRRDAAAEHTSLNARLAAEATGLFSDLAGLRAARLPDPVAATIEGTRRALGNEESQWTGQRSLVEQNTAGLRAQHAPEGDALAAVESEREAWKTRHDDLAAQRVRVEEEIRRDDTNRASLAERAASIEQAEVQLKYWRRLRELIGSHDGRKFRRFAQGLSLDLLVRHANRHLRKLSDRYRLRRDAREELNLEIVDGHQAGSARPMASLSGGESFLTSLALALGLSDLAGRNVRIDSLFVDEGFGSLDADTLDVAVAALESLRTSHKTIGIISHVELLKERITAQIQVAKQPGGVSTITIVG